MGLHYALSHCDEIEPSLVGEYASRVISYSPLHEYNPPILSQGVVSSCHIPRPVVFEYVFRSRLTRKLKH